MLDISVLREEYKEGTKVRLLSDLNDEFSPHFAGDILTVSFVDDLGQIHGSWKSGDSLALIPEIDSFEKVVA